MLFHSGSFLLLFTALIVAFAFRARALYLLLVSLFYCYACNEALVATLIFTTVVDYWIARVLHRNRSTALLVLSIALSLSILSFFKFDAFSIGLPIGICCLNCANRSIRRA